jgi:hypothetical protein
MQNNQEINIANLKQYLLGNLPPPDAEAIDLQIISDESSEEELLWAESELIEDYLDETLSPPEVELFKENFLVSPERRAQLRQISLVRNYARNCAPKDVAEKVSNAPPESFYEKLKIFFSLSPRPALAAFALVIAGLFAAAILYNTADNQTAAEKEYAEINRTELSDLAKFRDVFVLPLGSGAFRNSSGGAASKLPPDKLGERVLFRLDLPVAAEAADTFKAELVKDGKVIFTQNKLPFHNNPSGREMRLLLPAAVLKKGAYQIKVVRETSPESAFVYNFAVE